MRHGWQSEPSDRSTDGWGSESPSFSRYLSQSPSICVCVSLFLSLALSRISGTQKSLGDGFGFHFLIGFRSSLRWCRFCAGHGGPCIQATEITKWNRAKATCRSTMRLSICLSICLPICLSICLSIYLSISPSVSLTIFPYPCMRVSVDFPRSLFFSLSLSLHPPISPSLHFSIFPSVHTSIYLCIHI